jgi:hypothetical protein
MAIGSYPPLGCRRGRRCLFWAPGSLSRVREEEALAPLSAPVFRPSGTHSSNIILFRTHILDFLTTRLPRKIVRDKKELTTPVSECRPPSAPALITYAIDHLGVESADLVHEVHCVRVSKRKPDPNYGSIDVSDGRYPKQLCKT